jgi:phage baseplate assembly protein W
MARHDYAFPFRIDPASGQAARTSYEAHVDQMIRQVLLTDPGERADLPDFGCGLRQLIFVLQSLNKWLGNQIQLQNVTVTRPDPAQILVEIDYVLIETQAQQSISVKVV